MEEGGGRDRKRRRWRRHHKVWKAPFAIDLSPLAAILRSVPHHASPWNTILFPLGRPPSVGERVSPLCLRVFARVCAHAFYPPPNLRIYTCINTAHLFPWVESMDLLSHLPLTTPLRHDNATHANTTAVIIYRIRIRICITFGKCFFIVSTAIRLVFSFNGY